MQYADQPWRTSRSEIARTTSQFGIVSWNIPPLLLQHVQTQESSLARATGDSSRIKASAAVWGISAPPAQVTTTSRSIRASALDRVGASAVVFTNHEDNGHLTTWQGKGRALRASAAWSCEFERTWRGWTCALGTWCPPAIGSQRSPTDDARVARWQTRTNRVGR